jgi:hypothetical protein
MRRHCSVCFLSSRPTWHPNALYLHSKSIKDFRSSHKLINQCAGMLPSTAPLTYHNGSINVALNISCSNANGDYCGPFPMQTYYCGTSGSWSNDVETEKFSNCSAHISCDSRGGCVSYDSTADTQSFSNCNGGIASEGETLYGGGGSASASTTNSCGPCVLDPSLDPRCASKFASSGSGTTASSSSASTGRIHDILYKFVLA